MRKPALLAPVFLCNTKTMTKLDCLERELSAHIDASVIWMHGLGADYYDFYDIIPVLDLPDNINIRFIFPNAPIIPVTLNGGMSMRAWYDVFGIGERFQEDREGLDNSRALVEELIKIENERGVTSKRIILGGFSQGGAMALYTGLQHEYQLAGILALSSYLPCRNEMNTRIHSANRDTSIFMAHGTSDTVVPFDFGEQSKDLLIEYGCDVDWNTYGMPHTVSEQELKDIGVWIHETLYSQ
jgi:phospholipase/carboxylesterase